MDGGVSPKLEKLLQALPAVERFEIESLSCLYGADILAARHCGFKTPPGIPDGHWQHGWIPRYHAISPAMVICGEGEYRDKMDTGRFFVARQDEAEYLRAAGYRRAEAIGLPITYVPPVEQPRLRGRLLVMPVHSIETTSLRLDFESYADAIDRIRHEFDEVAVCVHPSCFAKGYWVESFEKRGYPIVSGASLFDRNGLCRMQQLMRGFEFITSNGFGSFLAYGAFFGAKVSIYGPECERSEEDYRNLPSNHGYPEGFWKLEMQAAVKGAYPFLFAEPWKAAAREAWGRHEVGADRVPDPARLRELFGWTPGRVLQHQCRKSVATVRRAVTRGMGHARKLATQPGYRLMDRVFRPTDNVPAGGVAEISVDGEVFNVVCGERVRREFAAVFLEQRFRFFLRDPKVRLIDGKAGCGLLASYLRREHPEAELVLAEPRPVEFGCLSENARRLAVSVENVVQGGLSLADADAAYWLDRGVGGRRLSGRRSSVDAVPVKSLDLRRLLGVPVGFLRLEMTDSEIDLLEGVQAELVNVANLVIDYRALFSGRQRLGSIMALLEVAGFRLHVREQFSSFSPLYHRAVDESDFASDHRVMIFAFRA